MNAMIGTSTQTTLLETRSHRLKAPLSYVPANTSRELVGERERQ
ncbi:MAG TPA: hypothetical protein VHV31_08280 [Nitrolancea sp.]|jgi:hypothetical protein|nr:hypothetical protein [Nitrolancea sp.]